MDELKLIDEMGWSLATDLDVRPGYWDREVRRMYTKEEALEIKFRKNKELFNIISIITKENDNKSEK